MVTLVDGAALIPTRCWLFISRNNKFGNRNKIHLFVLLGADFKNVTYFTMKSMKDLKRLLNLLHAF